MGTGKLVALWSGLSPSGPPRRSRTGLHVVARTLILAIAVASSAVWVSGAAWAGNLGGGGRQVSYGGGTGPAWGPLQSFDESSGVVKNDGQALTSVSCPDSSFCAATDALGDVLFYNGSSWTSPNDVSSYGEQLVLGSVSCASSSLCIATDGRKVMNWNGNTWSTSDILATGGYGGGGTASVSCPITTFCMVVDAIDGGGLDGYYAASWNGSSWTTSQQVGSSGYSGTPSVSCPSANFCAALAPALFTWSGSTTWKAASVPSSYSANSLSCDSSTYCMTVGFNSASGSGYAEYWNGTTWSAAGSGSWPDSLYSDLSCPAGTSNFCMATSSGDAWTWNGASWSSTPDSVDSGANVSWVPVSCPTTTFCVAVDSLGNAASWNSGTSSWSSAGPVDTTYWSGIPVTVSCPANQASFCMAGGEPGQQTVAGQATAWNGSTSTWTNPANVDPAPLTAPAGTEMYIASVSCPTASFCNAVDDYGRALSWTSTSGWTSPQDIYGNIQMPSISCGTSTFCVAVGSEDEVTYALTPSGATTPSWEGPVTIDPSRNSNSVTIRSVSCTSSTFCMAVDSGVGTCFGCSTGDALFWNGTSWSAPAPVDSAYGFSQVSCASSSFCSAIDYGGNVWTWTGGNNWTEHQNVVQSDSGNPVVSCGSPTFCAAIGNMSLSASLTAGEDSYGAIWNGTSWSAYQQVPGHVSAGVTGLSCTSSTFCMAVDSSGGYLTYAVPSGTAPTTTSITPSIGPRYGGSTVTITGSGFSTAPGGTTVKFGDDQAIAPYVSCPSTTECVAQTPLAAGYAYPGPGVAGVDTVMVATASGSSGPSGPIYYYLAGSVTPVITSISPTSGPVSGGTSITITGYNLDDSNLTSTASTAETTKEGGVDLASFTCSSTTSCTAVTPAVSTAGPGGVVVATAFGGTSNQVSFTYTSTSSPQSPTVTSISPASGPDSGGTSVSISGTNFVSDATVLFCGSPSACNPGSTTYNSSTSLSVVTPAEPAGAVSVEVDESVGNTTLISNSVGFTYMSSSAGGGGGSATPPTLTSISPSSGPTSGGTTVTITGTNLTGATAVDFGTVGAASFTVVSATEITAVSPGQPAGTVNVIVATPAGTSATGSADRFTYVAPAPAAAVSDPSRICDTRSGNPSDLTGTALSQCEGKAIGPHSVLTIEVAGLGEVPSGATGAYLNVTALDDPVVSYLDVYAAGTPLPGVSEVSISSPIPAAALVFAPLSSSGEVSVYNNSGTTQVIVDVEGFVKSAATPGFLYNPVRPTRICDTRPGNPSDLTGTALTQCEGKAPPAGSSLTFSIPGIPVTASAATINVTAVEAASAGYLTVYGAGAAAPDASNLDFVPAAVVSNVVTVPVSGGKIAVYASAGVQIVVDVEGYYGSAGAFVHAIAPTRICDTRPGNPSALTGTALTQCAGRTLSAGELLTISAEGRGLPVPRGASAALVSVTVTDTTSYSFSSLDPSSEPPNTSDLNWAPGVTSTRLVIVPLDPAGDLAIYNFSGDADVVVDVTGYVGS